MKIYFFSGLGADNTVFQYLQLQPFEPVHIEWLAPKNNETLQNYALRLKWEYAIPDDAVIAGLSFGGMLATEIAKSFPAMLALVISGAKTKYEIPVFYRLGQVLPLYKWGNYDLQKWFMLQSKSLFSLREPEHIEIYRTLIHNCSPQFNRWAVQALLEWQNTYVPANVFHIHGNADRILPRNKIKDAETIRGGGHLMVMSHAETISQWILKHASSKYLIPQI